jgi:hypothetical protein
MYSTCLFCNSDLGANQAVEHFPVGRRLAFDASKGRLWAVCLSWYHRGDGARLTLVPKELRLAMEMASHEDAERRGLEGELKLLEDAWRDAEEIASISDNLFLPKEVSEQLANIKDRSR